MVARLGQVPAAASRCTAHPLAALARATEVVTCDCCSSSPQRSEPPLRNRQSSTVSYHTTQTVHSAITIRTTVCSYHPDICRHHPVNNLPLPSNPHSATYPPIPPIYHLYPPGHILLPPPLIPHYTALLPCIFHRSTIQQSSELPSQINFRVPLPCGDWRLLLSGHYRAAALPLPGIRPGSRHSAKSH